jgi:hypothetical protein
MRAVQPWLNLLFAVWVPLIAFVALGAGVRAARLVGGTSRALLKQGLFAFGAIVGWMLTLATGSLASP